MKNLRRMKKYVWLSRGAKLDSIDGYQFRSIRI